MSDVAVQAARVVALAVSVVGVLVFARGVRAIVGVVSLGGPARRSDSPGRRWRTMTIPSA